MSAPGAGSRRPPAGIGETRHVPELDGVRGLAIAGVMALHFVNNLVVPANAIERAAVKVTNYGLWGVDLFFVLSGFLITGILVDTRARGRYFSSFFARRALRIFPLYFGVLLVLTVLVPARLLGAIDPELLEARALWPWLWSYLTNVYLGPQTGFSIPYVSHFWSLAIEEHFYLVWPFVIWWLPVPRALRLCLWLGVAALALRVYFSVAAPEQLYASVLTPCRIDALCAGGWFALAARHDAPTPRRTARLALAFGGLVVVLTAWNILSPGEGAVVLPLRTSALAAFFGAVIYGAAYHPWPRLRAALRPAWLRHLGRYSYGLYVFHGIVAYGMHRAGAQAVFQGITGLSLLDNALMAAAGVGVSYAVAMASYHAFEQRFLVLKDRFPSRAAPLAERSEPGERAIG